VSWCWRRIGRVRIWIGSTREFFRLFFLVASLFSDMCLLVTENGTNLVFAVSNSAA
jgi:hypothetical protein